MMQTTRMWASGWVLTAGCILPAFAQDDAVPESENQEKPLALQGDREETAPRGGLGLSDRMGRWSQHAMAARLDAELADLLHEDGLLTASGSADLRDRVTDVATRCGLLARSADEPVAKQMLYETQARSYNALAQDAIASGHAVEGARQLRLLRSAAGRLGQVDSPGSREIGAYWEMLADLIDANRTIASPTDRHLFARELLTRYVESHPSDEAGHDHYVIDAQIALAQMLDQVGDQSGAAEMLGPLGEIESDNPRYKEVQPVLEHLALVGQGVEIDLPMRSGHRWQSESHRGRQVLIHIYAAGIGPDVQTLRSLRDAIANADVGGVVVVSIRIGLPQGITDTEAFPPWPTALADPALPATAQLLESLGVDSVPAFVWLDEASRLASTGLTLEVLEQRPPLTEATDDENAAESGGGHDQAEPSNP